MVVRRLPQSWQYDFTIPGHGRRRKGGFTTKAEASLAERKEREVVLFGRCEITFAEAYHEYLAASSMKDRSRDSVEAMWKRIEPEVGACLIEEITTSRLDGFKQTLPKHLGPKSVNQYLIVVSAVLRFMWKRGKLAAAPYVPKEKVPKTVKDWYSEKERDDLLAGVFTRFPHWYLFFYVSMRLGLRRGEVYGLSKRQVRRDPPQLTIDSAVQRGLKDRPAKVVTRKNDEAYVVGVTPDVLDAIDWHVGCGYAGPEFLFSKDGTFPQFLDSYVRALRTVQRELGLRQLSHHALGRHSVASQAATGGISIKAIQAQLGHRSEQSTHVYAHLGSEAQRRLLEALAPAAPPHGNGASTGAGHVNVASTEKKKAVTASTVTALND